VEASGGGAVGDAEVGGAVADPTAEAGTQLEAIRFFLRRGCTAAAGF